MAGLDPAMHLARSSAKTAFLMGGRLKAGRDNKD